MYEINLTLNESKINLHNLKIPNYPVFSSEIVDHCRLQKPGIDYQLFLVLIKVIGVKREFFDCMTFPESPKSTKGQKDFSYCYIKLHTYMKF